METVQQLINKELEPKTRRRSGKYSPSSFGGCFRKQFWNRKDEPQSNPADERSLRVFAAGQLFHDFVQGLMLKNNHYEKEVCVDTQPDIIGYADLVNTNEVVDIKSQHSKSFWYMAKFKDDGDIKREKYHNWLQVMYYVRELKKEFARLVFISKDDLCIQEYVQKLDDYWKLELTAEIATLRAIWEKGELPAANPRLFKKTDKKGNTSFGECNYCAWQNKCFEMQGKKIEKEIENA